MGYPRKLLNPDEEIVFDLHPHWKVLWKPAVLAPLVVGAAAFGAAKVPEGDAQRWLRLAIVGVAAVLLFVWAVVPLLRWITTHFVVTNRRVIMRSGILGRSGRDLPLTRINDITFEHSFVERLLGAGTLIVESAGERGQVTLHDIPHVEEVQRELYRLVEAGDERLYGDDDEESPPVAEAPPAG